MKKLIISMVATASIALVAKADVLNATSFEGYQGPFNVEGEDSDGPAGEMFWLGGGTEGNEGVFEIKALDGTEGNLSAKLDDVARPKYWADQIDVADAKALAIDTDVALARHVNANKSAKDIGTGGLYFDSMVQFTATDTAPTVTPGDKLIVWLKEIPVEGGQPTYKLCITAADLDPASAVPTAKLFETEKALDPDTWHRLSIAAKVVDFWADNEAVPVTAFEVYLDSEKVVTNGLLYSMVSYDASAHNPTSITSVSFQGKGAIDDLVWTTEDPYAAPTKSYTVIVDDSYGSLITSVQYKIGEAEEVSGTLNFDPYDSGDVTGEFALVTPVDATSVTFFLAPGEDYEVEGGTFVNDRWVVTVPLPEEAGSQITLKIIEKQVVEPDPVKPFTVNGVPYETLAEAIANANGATITLTENIEPTTSFVITTAVTIDLNGKTIKANDTAASTDGNGVFWVQEDGVLTLLDSSAAQTGTVDGNGGNGYKMAVWADGGKVVINGGTYVNINNIPDPNNQYDLIYVKNGGSVEITGGTFKCQTPRWTLNSHNTLPGTFVVTGGRFLGYNPTNFDTDEAVTTWCSDDYVATEDDDGYYTVVRGYAVTVEADNAEVSALAAKYAAGATVTFTVTPATDYEVTGVTAVTADGEDVSITANASGYTFEMPAKAVTITVATKVCVYAVEVKAANAEVSALAGKYAEGATVTFTVTADEGYEVTSVTMNEETLTADNGTYTFKMPAEAVTIVVTTYKEPSVEPDGDTITEPISDTAKDIIKDQFPAGGVVIKVEVNGDTLKGDAAVKMINKVVDMFKGTPFVVDDQGVAKLELVFKVDDVMAIVNGLTGGYTLKAGNATFNTEAYEVVPRWYDIDKKVWDVDAPQDGATKGFFKLKVQKKAN